MNYKIGVISRSEEFIDLFFTLALNRRVDIFAQQAYFYQAQDAAHRMAKHGVEVIIARERTSNLISKSFELPIIHCDFNAVDILLSISKAEPGDHPLALIREESRLRGTMQILEMVEKLQGLKIGLISYSDIDNLEKQLLSAVTNGIKGVVGGRLIVEMAAQYGLNKIELVTSQETARVALEEAIAAAEVQRQVKRNHFLLSSVMNATNQALVLLDDSGKVNHMSSKVQVLTDLKKDEVLGRNIPGIPNPEFIDLLKRGYQMRNQSFTRQDTSQSISYHLLPIVDEDSTYQGCFIHFDDKYDERPSAKGKHPRPADSGLKAKYSFDDIIGGSSSLLKVKNQAQEFSKSDFNVLITGETGTGKELFAHAIHRASHRFFGPFVAINCPAVPPNLLESELFGYESGAFTGASKSGKKGLFEVAHEGTIFLDEIGEMPLEIQSRLLRVLESKEVMRLGGGRLIPIDFRAISSTNKDLQKAVAEGKFRSDLYYRLNTLLLELPPLRERSQDIPALMRAFLEEISFDPDLKKQVEKHIDRFGHKLATYRWPGNIRELLSFVERCCVEFHLLQSGIMDLPDLLQRHPVSPRNTPDEAYQTQTRNLKSLELQAIVAVGKSVNWNRKQMAEILGISHTTLWRKIRSLAAENGGNLPSDKI